MHCVSKHSQVGGNTQSMILCRVWLHCYSCHIRFLAVLSKESKIKNRRDYKDKSRTLWINKNLTGYKSIVYSKTLEAQFVKGLILLDKLILTCRAALKYRPSASADIYWLLSTFLQISWHPLIGKVHVYLFCSQFCAGIFMQVQKKSLSLSR